MSFVNFKFTGYKIKARQRSLARQMHDKLDLQLPDSAATN